MLYIYMVRVDDDDGDNTYDGDDDDDGGDDDDDDDDYLMKAKDTPLPRVAVSVRVLNACVCDMCMCVTCVVKTIFHASDVK